jgi:UDP-arabinose 4-epimerase
MRVLITGGAGYIGSHTAKYFRETGIEPVVFDNLSTGHGWAVQWGPLIKGDLSDARLLRSALEDHRIEAVIHFAASTSAVESLINPGKYFRNNISNGLTLLECMRETGVRNIVFSSSAAVYGMPVDVPISEARSPRPLSPYGATKLSFERALHWYSEAHDFRWAALRYFNAAGADPDGLLGEAHATETLIPSAIQAALGLRQELEIYGTDYPTSDGTAIRDYVHVTDLASAHRSALDYLLAGGASLTCNLGTGVGYSVREVVQAVERVSRLPVPLRVSPRRAGDAPALVAQASLAHDLLGWTPQHSDLDSIVQTALAWECQRTNLPRGFGLQDRKIA